MTSYSPKPSEEQIKVAKEIAAKLIRQEVGNGMFTCDDDLDGCPEIVSDKIKECFESIKSIISEALSAEFQRGREKGLEEVISMLKERAHIDFCNCQEQFCPRLTIIDSRIRALKGKTE